MLACPAIDDGSVIDCPAGLLGPLRDWLQVTVATPPASVLTYGDDDVGRRIESDGRRRDPGNGEQIQGKVVTSPGEECRRQHQLCGHVAGGGVVGS
jgi:hypothetical protein